MQKCLKCRASITGKKGNKNLEIRKGWYGSMRGKIRGKGEKSLLKGNAKAAKTRKNNRSISEDFTLVCRGIREFNKILPGQMRHVLFKSILSACIPLVAVFASAWILNELAGEWRKERLLFLCLFAVVTTFVLSALKYVQDAKVAIGYSCLFSAHEICLTQKNHRLPYEILEMTETERLREQVSGSISVSGAGMASLYWDMETVIKNLFRMAAAILLGAGFLRALFTVRDMAGQTGGGISGGIFFTGLVFLMGVCIFISCKMAGKHFETSFEVFKEGAKYQRYGEFYTMNYLKDENAAMDARIFSQEGIILRESQEKCYQRFAAGKRREIRALDRYDGVRLFFTCFSGILVYVLVGLMALLGKIGAGEVVAAYAAVTMFISALSELSEIITDLRNNNEHLLNFFRFVDLPEDLNGVGDNIEKGNTGMVEKEHDFKGIQFEHVSFRYPESEDFALCDINFSVRAGEKLAFVGENGSGKTTLVKLICRLYRPTQGRILLDGVDIWSYPHEEYKKRLSVVFQDFSLFAFSIAENVAASNTYDRKRVEHALAAAGLLEKVSRLPEGVNQPLFHYFCEDGCDLSGGEAQKLAIARAIYKDGDIMVLDEPTAALDPFAEADIYKHFGAMSEKKTAFLVSHRLSSCQNCDRVAVFFAGRLVQLGSHKELVLQEGKEYARLWEAQAQYYR